MANEQLERDAHFAAVVGAFQRGDIVPFLGAGVNLAGRPKELKWDPGDRQYLPRADELAGLLAKSFGYVAEKKAEDLANVSQYVAETSGTGPLYNSLHALFDADYPLPAPHRLLADIPKWMRDKGYPLFSNPLQRQFVILTTNYDDLMERAFSQAGEAFHVLTYIADVEKGGDEANLGRFWHISPAGKSQIIKVPNKYADLSDGRPVIVKLHGAIDRKIPQRDSYVITENHYIEYLARPDITRFLPVPLPERLKHSSFLFMGYSLRDWNLRVILHRLWGRGTLDYKSWSVNVKHDEIEKSFWKKQGVDIFLTDIGDYADELGSRLAAVPHAPAKQAGGAQ